MVNVQINLLKKRRVLSEKEYQKEKEILQKSLVGLVIAVVIVVAFSTINLVMTSKLRMIEQNIVSATQEMQGLSLASVQQVYLKSRLKLVTDFLGDRSVTRESLQKLFSTSIVGVNVTGVTFEENSILGVQYIANSYPAIEELLSYYQADTGYFTQAISRGITRSKDGSYQISIALSMPKGAK